MTFSVFVSMKDDKIILPCVDEFLQSRFMLIQTNIANLNTQAKWSSIPTKTYLVATASKIVVSSSCNTRSILIIFDTIDTTRASVCLETPLHTSDILDTTYIEMKNDKNLTLKQNHDTSCFLDTTSTKRNDREKEQIHTHRTGLPKFRTSSRKHTRLRPPSSQW